MLSCKQATALASQARHRRLTRRERLGLWLHRVICVGCRRYERQIRWLQQIVRRQLGQDEAPGLGPDVGLSPEARSRIVETIERDRR